MAEINVFPGYAYPPNRDQVETREFKTTFSCLDNTYYDVVDMHSFQIEQHLRATERYFPQEAKGWFKQHSTSPGYALRYNGKTYDGVAGLTRLPVIRLWPEEEPYLLVYELGPITMVQLAVYQAIAHGAVEPYMLDVIFSSNFAVIARDVMGPKTLDSAYRRMTKFGMLEISPSRRESRPNSRRGPDPTRDGRRPDGYYLYGPNKGKPYYRPEGK